MTFDKILAREISEGGLGMNLGGAIESLNEERIYQAKYEDEKADKSMAQAIRILTAAQECGLTEDEAIERLRG